MSLRLVTVPAAEPLSTAQAKSHLRVDASDEDTLIDDLVKSARESIEEDTGLQLITATWRLYLDQFPATGKLIRLPRPPLQSVSSIKYYDADGVLQTWTSTLYLVDIDAVPARIAEAPDEDWPDTQDRINAVEIEFVSGYGLAGSDLPEPINSALKLQLGHLFENREDVLVSSRVDVMPLVSGADAKLTPYRVTDYRVSL